VKLLERKLKIVNYCKLCDSFKKNSHKKETNILLYNIIIYIKNFHKRVKTNNYLILLYTRNCVNVTYCSTSKT